MTEPELSDMHDYDPEPDDYGPEPDGDYDNPTLSERVDLSDRVRALLKGDLGDLGRFGKFGWRWTFTDQSPWRPQPNRPVAFKTNEDGEGLWLETIHDSGLSEWRQIHGTAQYCLRGGRVNVKAKIQRHHGGPAHAQWVS